MSKIEIRIVQINPLQSPFYTPTGKHLDNSFGVLKISHPEMRDQIQQKKVNKGTLLIFHHDGWKENTPMFVECNHTWGQFLGSLKLLCETRQVPAMAKSTPYRILRSSF